MEYRVLGMSDRSECECCGKSNLKRTVSLEILDSGEVVFYGVDCAAMVLRQRHMGKRYPVSRDAIKSMAARAKNERVILEAK